MDAEQCSYPPVDIVRRRRGRRKESEGKATSSEFSLCRSSLRLSCHLLYITLGLNRGPTVMS